MLRPGYIAYYKGRVAALENVSIEDCPYETSGVGYREWQWGYKEQKNDLLIIEDSNGWSSWQRQ